MKPCQYEQKQITRQVVRSRSSSKSRGHSASNAHVANARPFEFTCTNSRVWDLDVNPSASASVGVSWIKTQSHTIWLYIESPILRRLLPGYHSSLTLLAAEAPPPPSLLWQRQYLFHLLRIVSFPELQVLKRRLSPPHMPSESAVFRRTGYVAPFNMCVK